MFTLVPGRESSRDETRSFGKRACRCERSPLQARHCGEPPVSAAKVHRVPGALHRRVRFRLNHAGDPPIASRLSGDSQNGKPAAAMSVTGGGDPRVERRMVQASIHPPIKDYEAAQDSVGTHFAPLGLVRGQKRAAWIREARSTWTEPPTRRTHARPSEWRASEDLRLSLMDEGLGAQALRMDQGDADANRRWRSLEERELQIEAPRRRDLLQPRRSSDRHRSLAPTLQPRRLAGSTP